MATGNTHSLWLYVSSVIFALIFSGKLNFEVQTTGAISYDDARRQEAKYSSARTANIYVDNVVISLFLGSENKFFLMFLDRE